jgi:hypothetical protein
MESHHGPRAQRRQGQSIRFVGRSIGLVFLLLLFLYVIMCLIWVATHRCEPAQAFWLRPRWPLLWSFAFAFLLLFYWTVFSWGAAVLHGIVRGSDHTIFAAIVLGLAVVVRSMFGIWDYVEHERLYLAGYRFGAVDADSAPYPYRSWSNSAFLGWDWCAAEPSRSYDKYRPALEPWPADEASRNPEFWDLR